MGKTMVSGASHSSFRNSSLDWVTQITASPWAAWMGLVAQDDLAGDHVLHVRLEALQGGAGHVIDAQLLNVEQGGDGRVCMWPCIPAP